VGAARSVLHIDIIPTCEFLYIVGAVGAARSVLHIDIIPTCEFLYVITKDAIKAVVRMVNMNFRKFS